MSAHKLWMIRLSALALTALPSGLVWASPEAHAEGGHGGAHGHGGGFAILGDRDFWLHIPTKEDPRTGFLILLINFGALMYILNKILFKNLRSSNAEKSDRIKLELERASEARAKAETMLADYKARIADLQKEVETIKSQATELAEAEGKAIVEEAREEAAKIRRAAEEAAEREAIMRQRQIEDEVVDRALEKAEAMILQSFADADQKRLVDSYISEVDAVDLSTERKAG